MAKHGLLAKSIYHLCRPLIKSGRIGSDAPANYFQYEVDKSPQFDDSFALSLEGKVVLEIGSKYGGYVYHALTRKAKFVYGVEIEEEPYRIATSLLSEKYDGDNYEMLRADARDLTMVESNSVDLIVSDAVLEHIQNVDRLFDEIARVLVPGGKACLATSPIWYTHNGGHQWRYIPLPWIHVLVPDSTIVQVLKIYKETGEFPADRIDSMIVLYETIGKLSLRRVRKCTAQSGMILEALRNDSDYALKRLLTKFPILEEMFAGNIRMELRKPA